ncbi:hypothetical protein P355_0196 [Burkholderia cenocepacia KC-01]|nr:hypothetical protein P355_0196 [Burkholderia cenocepacia KC-01]
MGRGRPEGTRLAMDGGCGRRTTRGESLTCLAFRTDFDGLLQADRREKEGIGRGLEARLRWPIDDDAGAGAAATGPLAQRAEARGPRQPRRNACCNHGHSADAAQARLLSETA